MKVQQLLVAVLLVMTLMVPTGIAEKGKRKAHRKKQASAAPSGTPPVEAHLPTENGWATGDRSVQDLFATANALVQRGEYTLADEGFGVLLSREPNNPVFRVEFARNKHRAEKMKAKAAAQDDEGADAEAVTIIGQRKE